MATNWVSAREAIRRVTHAFQAREQDDPRYDVCLKQAEEAILLRLRKGALKTMASHVKMGNANPFRLEDEIEIIDGEVPSEFWWHVGSSEGWGGEWVSGDFVIQDDGPPPPPIYGSAFNVHFDGDNLPGLARPTFTLPAESVEAQHSDSIARGRPPKWDWDGVMAHLVAIANQPDGLEALANGTLRQANVEQAMSDWFTNRTGDSPSISQIRPRAAAIMLAIAEVEKSKPDF